MTNAPPTRKTHITRIVGTNKNGDVLQDMWADLERMDIIKNLTQTQDSTNFQGYQRKFRWQDDPNADDYNPDGNPARQTKIVKVCSPDEANVNDPEEWIPVPVIKITKSRNSAQGQQDQFHTGIDEDKVDTARVLQVRRIVHFDTNIDANAQAAFDADPNLKVYVVQGSDYVRDESTKDTSQFVEHEIVTYLKHRTNENSVAHSGVNRGRQTKLLNQYLIDESDEPDHKVVGSSGINPPYRLDPFQNIINIQLSSPQEAVIGIAPTTTFDRSASITRVSKDGLTWDKGFGISSNAATGLGHTVVCASQKYVAFGKPRDGVPCFISVDNLTNRIERGILDNTGELSWTVVAALPIESGGGFNFGVQSLSFAGGAFFVSYSGDDNDVACYLAVSFDGLSFRSGIQPFSGVLDQAWGTGGDANGPNKSPDPIGGSVTYDKDQKIYVTAGAYLRAFIGQIRTTGVGDIDTRYVDDNFMSSVSTDGFNWSPKFDVSEAEGIHSSIDSSHAIAGVNVIPSNVCFGKGVFVAATGYKLQYQLTNADVKLLSTACAVATSSNGQSWLNRRLPGSVSNDAFSSGESFCVGFFKTGGSDGFFVAAGSESGVSLASQNKIWRSDDGIAWTLVRTDAGEFDWILSAINKSHGKVVTH